MTYSGRSYAKVSAVRTARGAAIAVPSDGGINTIISDPLDARQLMSDVTKSFEQLRDESLDLRMGVQDGVILPNLKMAGEKEQCVYLNEKRTHVLHPSVPLQAFVGCFPLHWTCFENGSFRYFFTDKKSAAGKAAQSRKSANGSICRNLVVMRRLWRTAHFFV